MDFFRKNTFGLRRFALGVIVVAALAGSRSSEAIILARTGDPSANTTVPTNDPAGSGWNYEGQWGSFLGTPVAPHFFLAAAHVGQADSKLVYGGVNYPVIAGFQDPFSDLIIWQTSGTFPTYAPMYAKNDETGQRIVAIGRGTQRGTEFDVNGVLRGWNWGPGDNVQRWGENIVTQIATFTTGPNDALYAIFDQDGLTNECHFSTDDSSGAVFINDAGVWKVAGINYAVDGNFFTDDAGDGKFIAALFNVGGFYYSKNGDDNAPFLLIPDPTPTGFYATRVSSKLPFIESVIDPNGIANGDGIPNLLEYAKTLNGAVPQGYGTPTVATATNTVSITYRKITANAALVYQVQQSTNLASWGNATTQDNVIATNGNVQTVQSTVTLPPNQNQLFLLLQVTQSTGGQSAAIATPIVRPARIKKKL